MLCAALMLPKMMATLTSLLPGFSVVTLCTGNHIERITLGPNGQPVDVEETDHTPCVVADPSQVAHSAPDDWIALTRSYAASFVILTVTPPKPSLSHIRPPSQAPPSRLI